MYSRHFCLEFPHCSYELLFYAGLWLQNCGRQMSTRLFRILHCALRWGLEAEESRDGGITDLESCWPLQRGVGRFVNNFYQVQL